MTGYNLKHRFSSPWRVRQTMQSLGLGDYYLSGLSNFKESFVQVLSVVYDKYTVQEWMEQHLDTIVGEVNGLIARAKILTENDVWPRRPLALTEKPTSTSSTLKVPKGEAQTAIKDDASVS